MDDQSVKLDRSRRTSGRFLRLPPGEFDMFDLEWLTPIKGLHKIDFKQMMREILLEKYDVWRLPYPAQGIAVTYPSKGLLFIHYLHGRRLFDSLTTKDLLLAAKAEGLEGVAAETTQLPMKTILERLGFVEVFNGVNDLGNTYWLMELRDGGE